MSNVLDMLNDNKGEPNAYECGRLTFDGEYSGGLPRYLRESGTAELSIETVCARIAAFLRGYDTAQEAASKR